MATWGLTENGFNRPTQAELIIDGQERMKGLFGANWNVDDNSRSGLLIKNDANSQSKVWQALESVYYSQTKAGAEGNFLDERYSYLGVKRRGATKGVGGVLVEVDSSSADVSEIVAGSLCTGTNGITYSTTTLSLVRDNLKAYKISDQTLSAGSYDFEVNTSSNGIHTTTAVLASNSLTDRVTFFNELKVFFDVAFPTQTNKILVNTVDGESALYVGFDLIGGGYIAEGMDSVFSLTFASTVIGNRFVEVQAEATEAGYNPLEKESITTLLPTPAGFVSVSNLEPFNSGQNVETDAEFSVKGEARSDTPRSSTKTAIVGAMLGVDGVISFVLNKSLVDDYVVLTPVVIGGTDTDIATELERTQPANNHYSGTTSVTVTTKDGIPEEIRFTRASEINRNVRVSYSPVNGRALSATEIATIKTNIFEAGKNNYIGGRVFNGQLEGTVFSTNPNRFLSLTVETKFTTDPDSSYSTVDFTPNPHQLTVMAINDIEVVRI